MKLTPSSTARRKTFFAFSRSGGQPQIPSPVNRIAPKPSRLTNRVESRAFAAAATSFVNPPVKTPAAPAEITPKKFFVSSQVKYVAATNAQALHPRNLSNNEILEAARRTPNRNFSLKSHRAERRPMREISHRLTENA